jgi:hypothetical protein
VPPLRATVKPGVLRRGRAAYDDSAKVAAGAGMRDDEEERPLPDARWAPLVRFLRTVIRPRELLLAPNPLIYQFPGTISLHVRRRMLPDAEIAHYVLKKDTLDWVDPEFMREAAALALVFEDELFVVHSRNGEQRSPDDHRVRSELGQSAAAASAMGRTAPKPAAVVTTHNRSWALRRTLRSLARQFDRIVVVDDGSEFVNSLRNRAMACWHGATYVRIPENIGIAHALNVGIGHWLAHSDIEWISTFNDDVELAPGAMETIAAVSREAPYPTGVVLFSGYQSPLHPVCDTGHIAGIAMNLCASCPGMHMHAHREYWQRVLPIPTAYLGAPKIRGGVFPGHGADEDWWVASWSPGAGIKRGGAVIVIPGLVTTFGQGRSTWGAPGT